MSNNLFLEKKLQDLVREQVIIVLYSFTKQCIYELVGKVLLVFRIDDRLCGLDALVWSGDEERRVKTETGNKEGKRRDRKIN